MKISILDDYLDTLRTLACFDKLAGHDVTIWNDHVQDVDALAERLRGHRGAGADPRAHEDPRAAARAAAQAPAHQPAQRLSAHRRRRLHAARRDRVVEPAPRHAVVRRRRADLGAGARGDAPDPAADGVAARPGNWQIGVGNTLRGKTLGIYGYGRIGARRRRLRQGVRHERSLVWAREASLARARADGYATAASKEAFFEDVRRRLAAHAPGRRRRAASSPPPISRA